MDNVQFNKLWKAFVNLGQEGLKANHYTLAEQTSIKDVTLWKEFLMSREVSEYIQEETRVLQDAEFRSILLNTEKDSSVGRSQLLKTFMDIKNQSNKREGDTYIYSYVPLNNQQKKSKNVRINDIDIFLK